MEGQAIRDLEKSLVTCMYWCKFWYSRSTCKEGTSQSQYSGNRGAEWKGRSARWFLLLLWVHSQSDQVLTRSQENHQRSMVWSAGMLDFSIHIWSESGHNPHLPDSRVKGCSRSGTASSLTATGKADLRLCFLTARRPRNRHIFEMHANLNSEETHLVAREELPAWSTGSTVPLNWCIHIKGRHLNNAKG